MSEIVLSNTTTFFTGRLESVFKKAKKYGIRYLEILPYRWTTPAEVLNLEKKYNIQIAGIHLPLWWEAPPNSRGSLSDSVFQAVCNFFLGSGRTSSAFAIAEALAPRAPYLLVHSDMIPDMGAEFQSLKKKFHVVVENVPGEASIPQVFDPGHYGRQAEMYKTYEKSSPEIFHVSYDHGPPYFHDLPDAREEEEMQKLFQIHQPKYVVLETYPWVSAKKGIALLRKMILNPPAEVFGVETELPAVDAIRD